MASSTPPSRTHPPDSSPSRAPSTAPERPGWGDRSVVDGHGAPDDEAAPFDLDPLPDLVPLGHTTWQDRIQDLRGHVLRSPSRWLGFAVLALGAAAVAWWLLRPPAAPPIESVLPLAGAQTSGAANTPQGSDAPAVAGGATTTVASTTTQPPDLVVQAAGAVARPGVYRLPPGARVDDLVSAAGGLIPTSDGSRLNLAAPLADGERIWVPKVGEGDPPPVVTGERPTNGGAVPTAGDGGGAEVEEPAGPIDLNTASEADLEALPGVGPATAAAIVAHREAHGPFSSVDDLLDVRGIGDAKLEQIRPMATV